MSAILQYVVICLWCLYFRTLFAQFLAQKIEKEQMLEVKFGYSHNPTCMQDGEINEMRLTKKTFYVNLL